jgi:hypothetical protein
MTAVRDATVALVAIPIVRTGSDGESDHAIRPTVAAPRASTSQLAVGG